ncbi:MAG: response regulator transcription factor [Clostridia bacterium]|nr:response regulator transcription factor [Clostridia bacterium]
MSSVNILVVDDDKNLCRILEIYLKKQGYNVTISNNGTDAVINVRNDMPDLVILDIMLPGMNGWDVCREIRLISKEIPIIMLTAKGEKYDKIKGLDIGADYYITKPFDPDEVIAHVKAILRRVKGFDDKGCLEFPGLKIDKKSRIVKRDGKEISLAPKEFDLLWFLASNERKVFTRQQLLDEIWGFDFYGDERTVDTHIKKLRQKIENEANGRGCIHTVWGVGYKFEVL